ncbi:flagellar biosynthesis protein FlhA [Alicyclobacillus sacchari]|uniref:Flagellar biosynthesis protein FlhA n=1 Tax=Alicyclobacillus sacchari TaxID=392010 RepID=A0A4R8LUM6_9BACL|nr:flagellar biosynthesis protein FlhA [Alicyclobacillus sacchari]TDY50495.1 flagellar biosynthesis protein FlhA [Alicyclobacillus sacchari]GMA59024.1 flagellar biosynthesis protein FlhA [Alicyclobacillus sacchari]
MGKWVKRTDLIVMIFVLFMIVMIVIPIPKPLLDVLIILNIFLSMTILLVAMSAKEPLEFSVFPSMLLITTLYRLSLNISTTRLILGQGDAGSVINTFGNFVIGQNPIVGFIVFLIIIIVQFIVITRGAERVAEVAARFTLDAMPGKQIAIDADLNAGLINEQEARQRRQNIEREADFYGAMDGASKFVKGDAIASILIVAINIVAGFIIAVAMKHEPFTSALHTYTMLSVGDGLVSQIPALLLSTATGLMVSRAVSDGNMGDDVVRQVFGYSRALYIVSAAILLLGIVTPIGILPVLLISGGATLMARRLQTNRRRVEAKEKEAKARAERAETKKPENVYQLLTVEPVEFEFGYGIIPLVDAKQGGDLMERVVMIRRQLAIELGLVLPMVRMRDNVQLKPTQYIVKLKGVQVAEGEILIGHWLALSPGLDNPNVQGIPTKDPTFGLPALWVNSQMKIQAEASGYTVVDAPSVIATHLTEILRKHAHELLGRQETKALLDHLKTNNAAVVEDVYPGTLSLGQIQNVLSNLLEEGVSIRDLVTILETLADAGRQTQDIDTLTERVRQALGRQICHQFTAPNEPLTVLTFGAEVEGEIQQALVDHGGGAFVGMEPTRSQMVFRKLQEEMTRLQTMGKSPILVVHPRLRLPIRRWISRYIPDLPVLSFSELDPSVQIQSGGVVNLT